MAKISTDHCDRKVDNPNCRIALWIFNMSVCIVIYVVLGWHYCRQKGTGSCRKELHDGDFDYVRSNLTSDEKNKCEKYESGTAAVYDEQN